MIQRAVFSIIFLIAGWGYCLRAEAAVPLSKEECYSVIKEQLRGGDSVKIENVNGYAYSGFIDKIGKDSIRIRYKTGRFDALSSSIFRQSFAVNDIKQIDLKGDREKYLLKKDYMMIIAVSAGVFTGYLIADDTDGGSYNNTEKFDSKKFFLTVGASVLAGELFYRITSKKIPLELSIQCK